MLPLTAVMTAVLYRQNANLTIEVAQTAMDKASAATVANVRDMVGPVVSTVELWAMIGKSTPLRLRRLEAAMVMMKALSQLPSVYSLYYGFEADGTFLQVIRLPPETKQFGPQGRPPPPDAHYVLRTIDNASGAKTESYIFYSRDGMPIAQELTTNVLYDPRDRPWYKAATATDELAKTNVYLFSSIDQPGLTFSRRITNDAAELVGVFGADILTATFSDFLSTHRIGRKGISFIFDDTGTIVAYPDPAKMVSRESGGLAVANVRAFEDASVTEAVRYRDGGAGDRFRVPLGEARDPYLVSFDDLSGEFGQRWIIGTLADENEFVGPLQRASFSILAIGTLFLFLVCMCVMRVSRFITRPVGGLIEETQRLRRFELDATVTLPTRITEIQSLVEALSVMKSALRSFGRYVPREVVREIVARGDDVSVGGGRRAVTVMFTDIANFTKTTETWPPERVLADLSRYFETVSHSVLLHKGTIDKFIGDAVMALWNAPVLDPDHAANACLAALACRSAVRPTGSTANPEHRAYFSTRYGIHTGTAVVGNVGSNERLQYTALGAMVNFASRLEALNKRFGTEILISKDVEALLRGRFELRPLGPIVAAGTSQPIEIFEVLGTSGERSLYPATARDVERNKIWRSALDAYLRRRWSQALQGFDAYLARYPGDAAALLMQARCEIYIDAPPPGDREVSLVFDEK